MDLFRAEYPLGSRIELKELPDAPGLVEPGIHPGGKLGRGEGLGHIVVRPRHQAGHLVHLLRAGREHDWE